MEGVCDRACKRPIPEGEGYLFYSARSDGSGSLSRRCEECATELMTPDAFERCRKDFGKELELTGGYDEIQKRLVYGDDIGIVARCAALGLAPAQAKTKARELMKGFWRDSAAGKVEALAFWTSGALKQNAPKRLWQFWKK